MAAPLPKIPPTPMDRAPERDFGMGIADFGLRCGRNSRCFANLPFEHSCKQKNSIIGKTIQRRKQF